MKLLRTRPLLEDLSEKQMCQFYSHVNKSDDCWEWMAYTMPNGYGSVTLPSGCSRLAHRVSWTWENQQDIPVGYSIEHTCRNRACVNPDHLVPMLMGDNLLASPDTVISKARNRSHCVNGHELSGDNLLTADLKRGVRGCRTCHNARRRQPRKERTIG